MVCFTRIKLAYKKLLFLQLQKNIKNVEKIYHSHLKQVILKYWHLNFESSSLNLISKAT